MSYVPDYDFDFEGIKDTQSSFKVEKAGKSTGFLISSIIKKHGNKCIQSLNKAGFNFSNLDRDGLKYIIDNNGIESIELLQDVGVDLSKLDDHGVYILCEADEACVQLLNNIRDVDPMGEALDYTIDMH